MDPKYPQFAAPESSPVVSAREAENLPPAAAPPAPAQAPVLQGPQQLLMPAAESSEAPLADAPPAESQTTLLEGFVNTRELTEEDIAAIFESLEQSDTAQDVPVDDEPLFEPFKAKNMDCTDCSVLREVAHARESRQMKIMVHSCDPGTFDHAVVEVTYAGFAGQDPTVQLYYVELFQRTHEWVERFITNLLDGMRSGTSTQMDGLSRILASPTLQRAAAPPTATRLPAGNPALAGNVPSPPAPAILASSASTAGGKSKQAQQRDRVAKMSIEEAAPYLHMRKADAAKNLRISSTTLMRICRKHKLFRWPARRVQSLNKQIQKLEEKAMKEQKLLKIKDKIDEKKAERARIYAKLKKLIIDIVDEFTSPGGGHNGGPPSPDGGNTGALPVN